MADSMDVDEFLASIELPVDPSENPLASDFHEVHAAPRTVDYRPSVPSIIFNAPIAPWAWNGRVAISVAGNGTETVCGKASVSDATPPAERNKPRISSFVPSRNDLVFSKFYDASDLKLVFMFLCRPVQQFARLFPQRGTDPRSMHILLQYMSRKELAAVVPAIWDDEVIGNLFFVPPTAAGLLAAMDAPHYLRQQGNYLTVALSFLSPLIKLPEAALKCVPPRPPFVVQRALMSGAEWRISRRMEPEYHLALNLTRLSADARTWAFHHPSILWTGDRIDYDWTTLVLMRALSHCRAGYVNPADPTATRLVGSVFIHVGALREVHQLPHLAALRKRPETRFYLYGTHPAVPPATWGPGGGVCEIYALGGVVTFSPAALARDPWGVLGAIQCANAHPLWACYVLPQVVGLAVRLVQTPLEDDLTQEEYRGAVPVGLDRVLDALLEGQAALMYAPGGNFNHKELAGAHWVHNNIALHPSDKPALFAHCEAACDAAFGQMDMLSSDTAEVEARARVEMCADLRRMQVQPAFVSSYRRYVVLDMCAREDADGIEWGVVGALDFQDGFVMDEG